MLEKTELAPILEDQVLEIEPTPVSTVAASASSSATTASLSATNSEDNPAAAAFAAGASNVVGGKSSDLAPVYEVDECSTDTCGAAGKLVARHNA